MLLDLSNEIDLKKSEVYYSKLKDKGAKIELKELSKKTTNQNSYLHVCITLFGVGFGYSIEEAKTLLKRECHFMVYEKNKTKFLKRCRDLDNNGTKSFIDWIRDYSSKQGYYIPTSEEYLNDKFNIDKEIEINKKYL